MAGIGYALTSGGVEVFQLALAAGVPWGAASRPAVRAAFASALVTGKPKRAQAARVAAPSAFEVVVPGSIWATERPVWYGGVRLRSRTTVVRLANDALWVHSPCPPTDDVCAALARLGEVRFIVVPNQFHHLETPATAARYPNARVVGPKSAGVRNPHLVLNLAASDPEYLDATPELIPIQLAGVPFLDETVFFHAASGSLIAADLLMCACPQDHWTWRIAARILGRYGKVLTPPDVQKQTRASAAVAESIAQLRALPLERILVAHADPITDRPAEQLADAWNFATSSQTGH